VIDNQVLPIYDRQRELDLRDFNRIDLYGPVCFVEIFHVILILSV
jgi:hypothetical protein